MHYTTCLFVNWIWVCNLFTGTCYRAHTYLVTGTCMVCHGIAAHVELLHSIGLFHLLWIIESILFLAKNTKN